MAEREAELAKAHERCPFVTMGQYFNTWLCGLVEQFGWKCAGFCVLQRGVECNPTDKIKSRIKHLKTEMRLAERLLTEAKDVDTSFKKEVVHSSPT